MSEIRLAIKSLARTPGFTFIAIATLALGIGANTSMFSVVNGYMFRPTPYPDSGRLDRIYRATPQTAQGNVAPADYIDLRAQSAGYGEVAAYTPSAMNLSEPGQPAETASGLRVSANLFSTLGTQPQLGRTFRADEEIAGNHRVLILGDRYWKTRFGGDGKIVGRTVRVDGEPYEIVGVLAASADDWRHLGPFDVFRPFGFDEKEATDRGTTALRLVGRRAGTVTRAQGQAVIADFGKRVARDFPAANAGTTWRSIPIGETWLAKSAQRILGMLVGLSGFVLLIACSNLANLLLARTTARAREFAVRSALGASRAQVLRPLFVESLLLALAGGVCAVFVAVWTFDWMAAASAGENGVARMILTLDWHVLAWAFGACLFTAVAFGVAPALFVQRLDLNGTLKSGARGNTGGRGHQRFRNLLIVGQFALAMVLLAGAALFVRGIQELNGRQYGWKSDHLVTATMVLPITSYPGHEEIADFQRLVLERLEALPGVASASVSYDMPFFGLAEPHRYLVAGGAPIEPGKEPSAAINGVSPHYFETVGTRLLSGRAFNAADTLASARVFIINEAMARGLFGAESPLGRRIAQAGGETVEWGEIVGIASDVESVYPDQVTPAYQLYQPMAQAPRSSSQIAVRTAGLAPSALIAGVRSTIMALDADLPVRRLQSADDTIARATSQWRVLGTVLSSLAMLGLGLAPLGIYGVIARTMAQRTSEFGIRLALGAQGRDITRLVLTAGAKLAALGSAFGLLGAFGIARLIGTFFPAMQPNSVPVLAGVTLILVTVGLVASYMPARTASSISPTEALRAE